MERQLSKSSEKSCPAEERKSEIIYDDFRLWDNYHTLFKPRLPLDEFYAEYADLFAKAYSKERQAKASALPPEGQKRMEEVFGEIFRRINNLAQHHDEMMA